MMVNLLRELFGTKKKQSRRFVLLSQWKADDYVEVELELDELDLTSAETKATYEEIKKYVTEHNDGMKVSSLYIA